MQGDTAVAVECAWKECERTFQGEHLLRITRPCAAPKISMGMGEALIAEQAPMGGRIIELDEGRWRCSRSL